MSIIKNLAWASHYQGTPTAYVVHLSRGCVAHQGVGRAFWFHRATAVISEVPGVDQELPALFHAFTADHQDVTIQVSLTYRFADPVVASQRLDFTVLPARADDATDGRTQASAVLTRLAQAVLVAYTGGLNLEQVMAQVGPARDVLAQGFAADQRLAQLGIDVVDLHVLAIRPQSDLEKALQAPLREQIQSDADKATYERRMAAGEQEQTLAESELTGKIQLATRRRQLVEQEGANSRRQAEAEVAAELVTTQGQADQRGLIAKAEAFATRTTGEAEAQRETALMASYNGVDIALLRALAFREFARGIPEMTIGDITITPDLLSKALAAWQA